MILTGFHAIEEFIKSGSGKGVVSYVKENPRISSILALAAENGFSVKKVSEREFSKLSGELQAKGILLEGEKFDITWETLDDFLAEKRDGSSLVVVLDGVTDPHNLGAVLRSAAQFDADIVLVPSRRSVKETDVVARTSAGASSFVPVIQETNLVRSIDKLKKAGYWVYGARMDGQRIDTVDFSGKIALVLGSEGKGMRDLVEKKCDFFVSIPTAGRIDSLNISVAAGIIMYDIYRKMTH